jgi:hypothetical protein
MRLLKVVEEYRAESEAEVKEMNESFKNEARTEGYILNAFSYTQKEKKSKGEVIDSCYLVKATKIYGTVWEDLN